MAFEPHYGDSDNTLLFSIAKAINAGGGGGGGGVATFNTRTGAVTLTSLDVTNALGFTPSAGGVTSFNTRTGAVTLLLADVSAVADARYVLKSGDTMTGQLNGTTFSASAALLSPLAILTPAANTIPLVITGYSQTGASAFSAIDVAGTWNTSGSPVALKVNITNTASGAAARLLGLQVGGADRFVVGALGNTIITPAANTSNLVLSGGSLTGVAGNPFLDISGAWNTAGDPIALKVNITNTASDNSALMDLQVGSISQFRVGKTGGVTAEGAASFAGGAATFDIGGGLSLGTGAILLNSDGSASFATAGSPFEIGSGGSVSFATGSHVFTEFGEIGFFSAAPTSQQTSGANLTNNVTAGGTDNTIADFADLAVFANSAATIRNDLYQLARKIKQINDGLRLYGLFS